LRSAAVIRERVGDVEARAEPSLRALFGVEDADLVAVGIHAEVRPRHLTHHQHQHRPAGVVAVPVRPALAAWEGDDLAFRKLFPPAGGAEAEPPGEDDQQLFALNVVVEHHFLAGP
jgi:hypothetical protein